MHTTKALVHKLLGSPTPTPFFRDSNDYRKNTMETEAENHLAALSPAQHTFDRHREIDTVSSPMVWRGPIVDRVLRAAGTYILLGLAFWL